MVAQTGEPGTSPKLIVPKPSHQTPKFPPTPSIHSTSRVSIRMMRIKYYTFTVIQFHATFPHARPEDFPKEPRSASHPNAARLYRQPLIFCRSSSSRHSSLVTRHCSSSNCLPPQIPASDNIPRNSIRINTGTVDILDERADASGGRGYRQDRAAELGELGWPNCARERARRACA